MSEGIDDKIMETMGFFDETRKIARDIRIIALQCSVASNSAHNSPSDIIDRAKQYEKYLTGE